MKLLNFGCGSIQPAGWWNVDRGDFGQPYQREEWALIDGPVSLRVSGDKLPFPDWFFDGIVASHSLQENGYDELPGVLADLYRVLRPGGTLRVLWPDVTSAVAAWLRDDRDWFPINDQEPGLDDRFCCYINWFGTASTLCTGPRLLTLLDRAGFHDPHHVPFGSTGLSGLADLDDREPEQQLIVEATK